MMEYELTFLIKELPKDLKDYPCKEIVDLYIPAEDEFPRMRIRKYDDKMELTKKETIDGDLTTHKEHTISLNQSEYKLLSSLPAKKIHKTRYFYHIDGHTAEIDVFLDELEGLLTAEFEFENKAAMHNFSAPDFCGADISQAEFIAGGMLAGKNFEEIKKCLLKKKS